MISVGYNNMPNVIYSVLMRKTERLLEKNSQTVKYKHEFKNEIRRIVPQLIIIKLFFCSFQQLLSLVQICQNYNSVEINLKSIVFSIFNTQFNDRRKIFIFYYVSFPKVIAT